MKHKHEPDATLRRLLPDGHVWEQCSCGAVRITLATGYVASWYEGPAPDLPPAVVAALLEEADHR